MSSCGCDGNVNSGNNQGMYNQAMNNQVMNNQVMNNQAMNNGQVMNNINLQNMNQNSNLNKIAQGNILNNKLDNGLNHNQNANNILKKPEEESVLVTPHLKAILYFLIALSINEMAKFFINNSIRLNKCSSSMYFYYPLGCILLLLVYNLFS